MISPWNQFHPGRSYYLGAVGVKVDGWDGGGEGVHFPLVGGNLVLQSTKSLQKNWCCGEAFSVYGINIMLENRQQGEFTAFCAAGILAPTETKSTAEAVMRAAIVSVRILKGTLSIEWAWHKIADERKRNLTVEYQQRLLRECLSWFYSSSLKRDDHTLLRWSKAL